MRRKDMARSFAVVLRKQRKLRGISQELLAEKADCDSTMVSQIERGLKNPTLNMGDSLAQGLGVRLSEMIKQAEDLRTKDKKSLH
jgi:transcriptional regulator with XRE-family HTH domain